jgi:DNA-binding beta-propeller fold protein YncE
LEYGPSGGAVAVYRLGSDRHPRFGASDWIGSVTLGLAVVGSSLSPNGRQLYVTSEIAAGAGHGPAAFKSDGSLSVIDVARAERSPSKAILTTVPAGRQPVRVTVSPNGSTVWVTARASNELLAFSARRLVSEPSKALLSATKVGTAPVGVALFDDGRRALVADSDRFHATGAHAALSIVNTQHAHDPGAVGTVRAGGFPREIAIDSRNDTALVTNFGSQQLETVPLATLP